jgi:hypothetical protein
MDTLICCSFIYPLFFVCISLSLSPPHTLTHTQVYSFPVTCKNGQWTIVQGLKIDEFSRKKMDITAAELVDEKKDALAQ